MSDSQKPQSRSNDVLQPGHRRAKDFSSSDRILLNHLREFLPPHIWEYFRPLFFRLGFQAATLMDGLSLDADKYPPQLQKRDRWGNEVDEIIFHPSYWSLMQVAVESQMMRLKWEPSLRQQFKGMRHRMGFALGMLYGMSESGQYCPLCMTDGVAHLIDRFCDPQDRDRLLPHIYSTELKDFCTGAMFLTEKAGGSDVGASLVEARAIGDGYYTLHGEKWFCSNVNAQLIFALARTDASVPGTRGLSIFLIERTRPDGSRNPLGIVRLKDKLGVRSMASGECLLDGTVGKLVGPEFEGFRVMTEMINLSRMYNSVAALAGGRRALAEAYQFLSFRISFGKNALEHSLVRAKLWELGAMYHASFALVWGSIRLMDEAETGDADAAEMLRLLTPMTKRESAETAVYICRESMELMGGMGYIEENVVAKVMRDVMVLPIWEGAGNIMILDMLRAAHKSRGLEAMLQEISRLTTVIGGTQADLIRAERDSLANGFARLGTLPQAEMEYQAKGLFIRLTRCWQATQLLLNRANPLAIEWLLESMGGPKRTVPPSREEVVELLAWDF